MASYSYTNRLQEVKSETVELPSAAEEKFEGLDLYGWEFSVVYNSSGYHELTAAHESLGTIRQIIPLAAARLPGKFVEAVDQAWKRTANS